MSYYQDLLKKVKMGHNVFIADTSRVLGKVFLDDEVSVWYGAVLRADFDSIKIGRRTNIQEHVVMHVDHGCPINIGTDNVIGHGAIVHGASIGDNNLIGMRATILNNAKIGNGCLIGAHALVTEGMVVPDFSMVLGTPGKIIKTLDPQFIKLVNLGVKEYVEEASRYLATNGE